MTKFSDRLPPNMETIMRELEALRGEVREMRAARRLEAATIGGGGITIQGGAIVLKDADGNEIGRLGVREDLLPGPGGKPQSGFILRRSDGSVAFTVDDPDGGATGLKQFVAMSDPKGHVIMSNDANSGFGLAAPNVTGGVFYSTNPETMPGHNGTGLWQVMTAEVPVYHPRYNVSVGVSCPSSGSGSVDLRVNGASQGVKAVPTNSFASYGWTLDAEALSGGNIGAVLNLEILVSRTAGTTSDYIRVSPNSIIATGS